ncbi:hypothetical protein HY622_04335 [Candidatus Uhrbacteria bacterium]|nr:hypothetical protein [Candidatus Uhrbacteria bacterium]
MRILFGTIFVFTALVFVFAKPVFAQAAGPVIYYGIFPNVGVAGTPATLEWSSPAASFCTGSFSPDERLPKQGQRTMVLNTGYYTYTLTCTSPEGIASAPETRTVVIHEKEKGDSLSVPAITFLSDKIAVAKQERILVQWDSVNAFACHGGGTIPEWVGLKHPTGSAEITVPRASVLTLRCWNTDGQTADLKSLYISVREPISLLIPQSDFSDSTQSGGSEKNVTPRTDCDRNFSQLLREGSVRCGAIEWRFRKSTLSRFRTDPLPALTRYGELYDFLRDYFNYDIGGKRVIFTDDNQISRIMIDPSAQIVRVPSPIVQTDLVHTANHPARPFAVSYARALTEIFLAHAPQRNVFLWHDSMLKSFSDLIGVASYLEMQKGGQRFGWWNAWCGYLAKPATCDSVITSTDQYAALQQSRMDRRHPALRANTASLYPAYASKNSTLGSDLFTAVTLQIFQDRKSVKQDKEFLKALRTTIDFLTTWKYFPESFLSASDSEQIRDRKVNIFVFLLSVHANADFAWYYERRGFPITGSTKSAIARFLSGDASLSMQEALDDLSGIKPKIEEKVSAGKGLTAMYFDAENFSNLKVTRIDPVVDFRWGYGQPVAGIEPDLFSARWTGYVEARQSDEYTFIVDSDDGVRLWVNNTKLIDDWRRHPTQRTKGVIYLEAGKRYPIRLDYFEDIAFAGVQLKWTRAKRQIEEIIPSTQLFPADSEL